MDSVAIKATMLIATAITMLCIVLCFTAIPRRAHINTSVKAIFRLLN